MKIEIDPDDVKKRIADSRGRVRIGTEHANKQVEVVVVGVADGETDAEANADDQ